MNVILLILVLATLATVGYLAWQNWQLRNSDQKDKMVELLFQHLNELRRDVQESGGKNREELNQRIDAISLQINKHQTSSSDLIKEITERLTKLDTTNQQVVNFAEQMKSLEQILKNPKQRGILGEYMLETLMHNVLQPNQYQMQYRFANGEIVDSAIFFNEKIIPIDAKFSLEKYNLMVQENDKQRREQLEKEFKMDVKNRIDETSKYIRPEEGTTEFAFMFIPAEGIYYNLLIYDVGSVKVNTHDLIEYAFSKRVIIVSPTSFFAYLETVLQGLKALKMEKSVHEILKRVADLGRHLNAYTDNMNKMGNHLTTTMNAYNNAAREYRKIDKDVYKITDGEAGGEVPMELLEGSVTKFDE